VVLCVGRGREGGGVTRAKCRRRQGKAASMGDPNPWLVQVRFLGGPSVILWNGLT
jgi:hypothetical protein